MKIEERLAGRKFWFIPAIIGFLLIVLFSLKINQQYKKILSLERDKEKIYQNLKEQVKKNSDYVSNTMNKNMRLIQEVDLKGLKVSAYAFPDFREDIISYPFESVLGDLLKITVEKGIAGHALLITGNLMYEGKSFMQVLDSKLWILNHQNRSLDVYGLVTDKDVTYAYFQYIKSIMMPNYIPGGLKEFVCKEGICHIDFVSNPSSGCQIDYVVAKGIFKDARCTDMSGEHYPKPE